MQWEFNVLTSVTLLAILQGNEVTGISQETSYVIECIRDIVPPQVYNDCCHRENNCTVARQQNRGLDCMGRMIMSNYSSLFSDSRESGPGTTDMNYSNNNRNQWHGDVLESLAEVCRRQPKARLQTCIRNELIKRCRYSMLQERFTSQPGRWNQRRTDSEYGYGDHYGTRMMEPGGGIRRRTHYYGGSSGGRRTQDDYIMIRRPEYSTDARYYSNTRGSSYGDDDADEEDFGYSDGDSARYN